MKLLTSKQLRAYFPWLTPWQKSTYDATYVSVDTKFLRAVSDDVYKFLVANGLTDWETFWDCDDFAHTFAFFAKVKYAKALDLRKGKGGHMAQSPAIGEVSYQVWNSKHEKPGAYHRINFYIDHEGELKFLEPQAIRAMVFGEEFVKLNKKEFKTIYRMAA